MNSESGMPSLMTLNEFCVNIGTKKIYPSESLGGFAYYIKKKGAPTRWPYSMWEKEFKEYLDQKK
jgi:hypothetical protein